MSRRNTAAGLMGQFKYVEAVDTLRPLVQSQQATDDLRVDLAIALLNRREGEDLAESAKLLDGVNTADPQNLRGWYCRGLLWFNEGKTDSALNAFKRVAEQDPADAYAAYYIGQCLLGKKEYGQAIEWFRKASDADPYLRSAPYGHAQALRREGDLDGSRAALAIFERLGTNPRARVAELKYTRMGPKAEVQAGKLAATRAQPPTGPVFLQGTELAIKAASDVSSEQVGVTVADLSGDGNLDLLVATPSGTTRVLLGSKGEFVPADDHPLAGVAGVNTALWGDYDDDGLVDVYFCRRGPNQLWRQTPEGGWQDVTDATGVAAGDANTIDGACYDFDHDGDLDYLLLQTGAPRELLSNNRDGTFRPLADELGIAGDPAGSVGMVVADLDRDDDADLVFLNKGRPHEVLKNDRLWNYSQADGFEALVGAPVQAAIATDADVDGQAELYTASAAGVVRWAPGEDGVWTQQELSDVPARQLVAYDFNGDAEIELVVVDSNEWRLLDIHTGDVLETHALRDITSNLGLLVADRGPELFGWTGDRSLARWQAGPGRFPFVRITLSGKTDRALEMRSNASGVGVVGVARVGERWAPVPSMRASSSSGQSLQPQAIGTAGAGQINFLRLLWPDGVSQTELNLRAGELHRLSETQRQAGSCPLLFVWDGQKYTFVADLLGAGGIGFNLGRGEYYPPRPEESFLLPQGVLKPRGDRLVVKLGEPMEEVCYFDAVRLVAYDLPPGWSMTLDERFAGMGPTPTGKAVYYQKEIAPRSATNDRGEDVTVAVRLADGEPAPLARQDHRFIGLTEPHSVTLEFESSIDELDNPVLVFDGWVEYPYSQSAFAAWQAGETFQEPTIEAQGADGVWQVVAQRFGYPAGTARQGSVALDKGALSAGAKRLRITSNMQVYWDKLAIIDGQPCPEAKRRTSPLVSASVDDVGFSDRTIFAHRRSVYEYSDRPPFGDARHPAGYYTAIGPATELVDATDDAVAIIGPGEELHAEFMLPDEEPPSGWTRRWVLEADGWCKDADLFTQDTGTVGPLPRRGGDTDDPRRKALHTKYNTRYRSGY